MDSYVGLKQPRGDYGLLAKFMRGDLHSNHPQYQRIKELAEHLRSAVNKGNLPINVMLTRTAGIEELHNYVSQDSLDDLTNLVAKLQTAEGRNRQKMMEQIASKCEAGGVPIRTTETFVSTSIEQFYKHRESDIVRVNFTTTDSNIHGVYVPQATSTAGRWVDDQMEILLSPNLGCALVSVEYDKSSDMLVANINPSGGTEDDKRNK